MALLNYVTLEATALYRLGNSVPDNSEVGRWVIQIANASTSPAWEGSAVVKARAAYSGLADSELQEIPYINVGTGAVLAAGTAITAAGIYEIPANGLEIVLDYTSTAGTAEVYPVPMVGNGPSTVIPAS